MTKTHWKKNIDSNFISGEDLHDSIKGLKPTMDVVVERFDDRETFDQNTQSSIQKSALYLKEINGTSLYKPVLLNKTNAQFFEKLTGSGFMDDWVGYKATLVAQADRRHGHVVRFKRYVEPKNIDPKPAIDAIKKCKSLDDLKQCWIDLSDDEKSIPQVQAAKNTKKGKL